MHNTIFVVLAAIVGGTLFYFLHIPLPWTLGPLVAALLWKLQRKEKIYWPKRIRDGGLIILGYAMGSPFTPEMGLQIAHQLPGMLAATGITATISLLMGWLTCRYTGVGMTSALIGSIPGGLTQMAVMCEEVKGADVAVVTLMQTVRMLTVVFLVPFAAIHGFADAVSPVNTAAANALDLFTVLVFAAGAIISAQLARLLHIPSPSLMGPVLGTAILIMCGFTAPALPRFILAAAQITVGIRMGADIAFEGLKNWKGIVAYSLVGVLLVLGIALLVDYGLTKIYAMSFVTAFIGTAPGGISEMGLTAMAVHADVPVVVAYQLFRLTFLLVVCMPFLKWWLNRTATVTDAS